MFSSVSLLEAFARVSSPMEWEEFNALRPANDTDYWIVSLGGILSARDREVLRYRELWAQFVEAMRMKLLAGEWVADGFNSQFGSRTIPIDARLWKILQISPGRDEAEGEGFRFINLSISQVRPTANRTNHAAKTVLRHELIRWIEALARESNEAWTVPLAREAARRAFQGVTISDYMFNKAWGAADKPEHFIQHGRPKLKGVGK
jgi:hypothetical protein